MSEAVDLGPIELALQAWVVANTGIADSNVIWSGYGRRRPAPVPSPQGTPPVPTPLWISLELTDSGTDDWPWTDIVDNPLVFAPFVFTAALPGTFTRTAHTRVTGDGPVRLTTTGTLPTGLTLLTDYWVITTGANTFQLADSFNDAIADTPVPLTISTTGTGTHTLSTTAETLRAGEEILEVVNMYTEYTLSIQCYGGLPTGNRSPMNVLKTLSTSTLLPSVRLAFDDAGLSVTPNGKVNNVGAVINTSRFEPRAHASMTVTTTASLSEAGGVITEVDVNLETTSVDNIDTADVTFDISR